MIHDLRVAIRRSGEVIRIMQQANLMNKQKVQRVMRVFRKVRRFAGDIRDLDVERDYLAKSKLPPIDPAAAQIILTSVVARRQKLSTKLHIMLKRAHSEKTFPPLMRTLENAKFEADEGMLKKELFRRIQKNAQKLADSCDLALQKRTPALIHQARIAGKRLRYAFELAHEARLADYVQRISELKRFQKIAGNLHDVEFIFENLSEYTDARNAVTTKQPGQDNQPQSSWDKKIHGRITQFHSKALVELKRIKQLASEAISGHTKISK